MSGSLYFTRLRNYFSSVRTSRSEVERALRTDPPIRGDAPIGGASRLRSLRSIHAP